MSVVPGKLRPLADCLGQIERVGALWRAFVEPANLSGGPLMGPLLDAVGMFEALQIEYALIGGLAAMVYGRPRTTDDVDFVAASGHEAKLGGHPEVMKAHHFDPVSTWKLYHESGVEIDLWRDEFTDGIAKRARTVMLEGRAVRVADYHDLIAMKLRAGRFQDDYDISEIIRTQAVDEKKIAGLVTAEQMEAFRRIRERANGQG